ncbi:hypothetical protein OE88DRAFT_1660195 [Heliocybe sulcata]|uniref:Uncharacterized protein n=1 Tax=Heliocybe sulcata TaxID=5364 RepID=A0A5C3N1E3_9AGAM|nr:hypothetical protein OE88DRAFT_1660195 [Heliocybe sulcata]
MLAGILAINGRARALRCKLRVFSGMLMSSLVALTVRHFSLWLLVIMESISHSMQHLPSDNTS